MVKLVNAAGSDPAAERFEGSTPSLVTMYVVQVDCKRAVTPWRVAHLGSIPRACTIYAREITTAARVAQGPEVTGVPGCKSPRLGNGAAWSGHLACTENISRVRLPDSPPC